jgi:predicted nucleic acid-binding protein
VAGYLIDTGVISRVRASGLAVADWIGDPDVAVSIAAVEEAFADLPDDDPKAIGNVRVLAQLPNPVLVTDEIAALVIDLIRAYAKHDPPLATNDAVMAATALLSERTLVTMNHRDFHYIEGLSWIDANGVSKEAAPLLGTRATVVGAPSSKPCCSRIRPPPPTRDKQ